MEIKEGWVTVGDIPTRFCSFGEGNDEKLKTSSSIDINKSNSAKENQPVILLLSGNPGVIRYYYLFLQTLYKLLSVPVWVLCHAGHENPPKGPESSKFDATKVTTQVEHKADFIRQFIPADKDVYIIAHSFGAKITIELLKQELFRKQIKKCYLLFPTLERIGDTRNGQKIKFIVKYLLNIILASSFIFSVLPQAVKWWLVKIYFTICGRFKIDPGCVTATVELINPTTLRNVFNLAADEMDVIRELDTEVIRDCRDKLRVYFGTTDDWAPVEYHYNLLQQVPKVDSNILDGKYEHCFVLETAKDLAMQLSEIIKSDIANSVR